MRGRINNQGANLNRLKYPIHALGGKRGKTQDQLYSCVSIPCISKGLVKGEVLGVCESVLPFLPPVMQWFPQHPCGNGYLISMGKTTLTPTVKGQRIGKPFPMESIRA